MIHQRGSHFGAGYSWRRNGGVDVSDKLGRFFRVGGQFQRNTSRNPRACTPLRLWKRFPSKCGGKGGPLTTSGMATIYDKGVGSGKNKERIRIEFRPA